MARYREKDETDLRWNRIRRRITMELDRQIRDWRDEALNDLLSSAWDKYVASLQEGERLELEPGYSEWVKQALSDAVDTTVAPAEAVNGDGALEDRA
jgi:hypothetical protein